MDHLLKVNCFRKLCSTLSLTFYKIYVNFPPFKDILITQSALHNNWGFNWFIKTRLVCPICTGASWELRRLLPFNHLLLLFVNTDNTHGRQSGDQ